MKQLVQSFDKRKSTVSMRIFSPVDCFGTT
jgi:hypothetical protein